MGARTFLASIFGSKEANLPAKTETGEVHKLLQGVSSRGGWWNVVRESYAGAWQQNNEWSKDTVLAFYAVYSCISLISTDIGKMRFKLMVDNDGLWEETSSPSFSPVLRKPNRYQNHIQFKEWWILSKLIHGNTYGLKQRDSRGLVTGIYILDPIKTLPLVSEDGSVYYDLAVDNLSGLRERIIVPASEIIHDRMNCLFHPLVGVAPLYACGLAADQGLKIQANSTNFFGNSSRPGGVLTAPGNIEDETAARLKEYWEAEFSGANAGRVAVLGDGLKFEAMGMKAVDAQLVEQLQLSARMVAGAYHVPYYMIDTSQAPTNNNVEALTQQYYNQCLQTLIESFELCMDEGLGLDMPKDGRKLGVELDITTLIRMDTRTKISAMSEGVKGGIYSPNEARAAFNLRGAEGGDTPYLQQQNFSLAALSKRDAKEDPFAVSPMGAGGSAPAAPTSQEEPAEPKPEAAPKDKGLSTEEIRYLSSMILEKELRL